MNADRPRGPSDAQIENAVLTEIIGLLPAHLTLAELVLQVGGDLGSVSIEDSIVKLKRSGLVRENGGVLEPTFAAFCAAEVFVSV